MPAFVILGTALVLLSVPCFAQERDTVEWLEDEMMAQLFAEGPFRASWETKRVRRADRETYDRLLAMQRKRFQPTWTPEFTRKYEQQIRENNAHWLSSRKTTVLQQVELNDLLLGKFRKTTLEADTGKKWDTIRFFTGIGQIKQIEGPEFNTFLLEPQRYELFWTARGVPHLWVLEYLRFTEGHPFTIERNSETGTEVWWFSGTEGKGKRRDEWALDFQSEGMIPIRARHLIDGVQRQDLQVIEGSGPEGSGPFPEKILVEEFSGDGEPWATEEVLLIELERVSESEIARPEVRAGDEVWDQSSGPGFRRREMEPEDLKKLLED